MAWERQRERITAREICVNSVDYNYFVYFLAFFQVPLVTLLFFIYNFIIIYILYFIMYWIISFKWNVWIIFLSIFYRMFLSNTAENTSICILHHNHSYNKEMVTKHVHYYSEAFHPASVITDFLFFWPFCNTDNTWECVSVAVLLSFTAFSLF